MAGRWISDRTWRDATKEYRAENLSVGLARRAESDVAEAVNVSLQFTDENGDTKSVVAILTVDEASSALEALTLACHEVGLGQ